MTGLVGLGVQLLWLGAYAQVIFSAGRFKGRARELAVAAGLCACALVAGWLGPGAWAWALTGSFAPSLAEGGPGAGVVVAWLVVTVTLALADAFFDEEPFSVQASLVMAPGLVTVVLSGAGALAAGGLVVPGVAAAATVPALWLAFALAMRLRGTASARTNALLAGVLCLCAAGMLWGSAAVAAAAFACELLVFELVEGGFTRLQRGFESSAEAFQQEVLSHQYEEIRGIYLDMRGWRHDYHNHLQVMKAHLAKGQLAELSAYLDDLEHDLDHVDTYVKSGNLMVDAVLNSKLSLAERQGVAVTCKALAPDELSVDDVDLCVILGNLLDNALESCAKVAAETRFLRVYLAPRGQQLYVSIQNAAVEDPDFDARHYITSKRGEHGFGMKRVAAVVDKYEGFLNLANEPGIFAAEVSLPL